MSSIVQNVSLHKAPSYKMSDLLALAPLGRLPIALALKQHGPYIVVVVELPDADDIRMVGKLLGGDPMQQLTIGPSVAGVFEHHSEGDPAFIARMESDLDDVIVGSSQPRAGILPMIYQRLNIARPL